MTETTPPPHSLERIGASLVKVLDGFRAEAADRRRERRLALVVGTAGLGIVLGVQSCLVTRSYENATRIESIAAAVDAQRDDILAQRDDIRTLGETAQITRDTVEEAKAEVAAAPKFEVSPPAKPGGQPQVKLVIPARPSKPATTATPSATAVPSSAPAPAVSIPLALPVAPTTATGGAP